MSSRKPTLRTSLSSLRRSWGNFLPLDDETVSSLPELYSVICPSRRVAFTPEISPAIAPHISEGPSSLLVQDIEGNYVSLEGRGLFGSDAIFKKHTIVGMFAGVIQSVKEWKRSCDQGHGRYGVALHGNRILNCYWNQSSASLCNTARGTFNTEHKASKNNCKLIVSGDSAYLVTAIDINATARHVEFLYPYGHRDKFEAPLTIPSMGDDSVTGDISSRMVLSQEEIEILVSQEESGLTDWELDSGDTEMNDEAVYVGFKQANQADPIPHCCQIVSRSNNIGLRALVTEDTRNFMLTDLTPDPLMTDAERKQEIIITNRQLFEAQAQLLVMHDSTALIPIDRVIGGGWCGPCSVALAEYQGSPDKSNFIVSPHQSAVNVVTALAHFLISKKEEGLRYANEHFSKAEATKFKNFIEAYIESGRSGKTTTRYDLWPPPHFLAAISDTPPVFWIEDSKVDACYLAFDDLYKTYSHLFGEIIVNAPRISSRPQIKLTGQHYELVWPVDINEIDLLIAFNRLADRVKAVLTSIPVEEPEVMSF